MTKKFTLILLLTFFSLAQNAYLPFEIKKITPEKSRDFSIDKGVWITSLKKGSLLESNGLKIYDIILTFNGQEVTSGLDIQRYLDKSKVGDKVVLGILRKNKRIDITTLLEEKSSNEVVNLENLPQDKVEHSSLLDIFKKMDHSINQIKKRYSLSPNTKKQSSFFSTTNFTSTKLIMDGEHQIEFSNNNGKKRVTVKDMNHKLLFQGDVNTDGEIKKVPKNFRQKVVNIIK